jgi:N-acetylglutamate synthase-like GNAT family acetyltransferase
MATNSTSTSTSTSTPGNVTLYKATVDDIPTIKAIIDAAYFKYIERIGKPPAPMSENWAEVIQTQDVLVLRDSERVVGSITFHVDEESDSLKIDNLVVDPTIQGRGYGGFLIKHAELEAQQRGLPSVTLFTNVKMFENIGFYAKLGFKEVDRKVEDGFERVYFYKKLS